MGEQKRQTTKIDRLAVRLKKRGLHAAALRLQELKTRLEKAMEGGSWLEKNRVYLSAVISRHVENTGNEWEETAHLLDVARRLLIERSTVSNEDMEAARRQLVDVLKTVPISAILAGTFLIPIPGAQPILAPILMERLGLLPSSWLESAIESELRDLIFIARKHSLNDVAEELGDMLGEVRRYNAGLARLRRFVKENPDWTVFFDENFDKKISSKELASLKQRSLELAREGRVSPDSPDWYVYYRNRHGSDSTRGPLTFREIRDRFSGQRQVLVRRGESSWWVPLWAVEEELDKFDPAKVGSPPD